MKRTASLRKSTIATAIHLAVLLSLSAAYAGSATWKSTPATGSWNTAGNWTPATIPNGPADTASFGVSSITGLSLAANVEVNAIVYNAGATAFTTSVPSPLILTISGTGITNNSGVNQAFTPGVNGSVAGVINFTNNATSGSQTTFTTGENNFNYGVVFYGSSNAGGSVFVNNGGTVSGSYGGALGFTDNATAATAAITNLERGNPAAAAGGRTIFSGSATAGNATIINKPNGQPQFGFAGGASFADKSKGGGSSITNEGASVSGQAGGATNFYGNSSADQATIICEGGQVAGAAGGLLNFVEGAKTGTGLFIANGGVNGGEGGKIVISTRTGAGSPRVQLHGNGTLVNARAPSTSRTMVRSRSRETVLCRQETVLKSGGVI